MYRAVIVILLLACASASAADSTTASHLDVTPKSPIPTGTVATWPMDAAVPPGWLACNGQAVPASFPELRALMASVPNYNNRQFLRGATSGAGASVAESTRSHSHVVPAHSHTVSGTASAQSVSVGSQSVTGTAEGQRYQYNMTWIRAGTPGPGGGGAGWQSGDNEMVYATSEAPWSAAQSSSISGRTSGGTYSTGGGSISGYTNAVVQMTESSGGAETAPMHTLVKYIIKAD